MLYDPKWETPVKADPMSLESLIAWLETKNPDEMYDFTNPSRCLAAQYRNSIGMQPMMSIPELETVGWAYIVRGRNQHDFRAQQRTWTFGLALERARTMLTVSRMPDNGDAA